MRIITNGTIFPKDERLIELLHNDKVYVYISNYGNLSRNLKRLETLFQREKYNTLSLRKQSHGEIWGILNVGTEGQNN